MRNDPLCSGAKILEENHLLPILSNVTLGKAKVTPEGKKFLIALPIKGNLRTPLDDEVLTSALYSLLDVCLENNLNCISLSETEYIDDFHWTGLVDLLKHLFSGRITKIKLCKNIVITPEVQVQEVLIKDIHESDENGHKGVSKTYNGLRQNYFWPNMKKDIQAYASYVRETN